MKRLLIALGLMAFAAPASFADVVLVSGWTTGTWLGSGAGTSVWTYATKTNCIPFVGCSTGTSDVEFDGTPFSGMTPYNNVYLGKIELNNGALLDPNQTVNSTLNFAVNFTTPSGNLSFQFPLTVKVNSPLIGADTLLNLPSGGSQSLTVGAETYTLALDGFFAPLCAAECGPALTQLRSPAGTTVSAYLYGDFAAGSGPVSVPDAGASIVLFVISVGGVSAFRKKRAQAHH